MESIQAKLQVLHERFVYVEKRMATILIILLIRGVKPQTEAQLQVLDHVSAAIQFSC